jgi:hypothetical protein
MCKSYRYHPTPYATPYAVTESSGSGDPDLSWLHCIIHKMGILRVLLLSPVPYYYARFVHHCRPIATSAARAAVIFTMEPLSAAIFAYAYAP